MGNYERMNEWNDIAVITPMQDIDISTVPSLRERFQTIRDAGTIRVIINCQHIAFIDSTGLAFLLGRARDLMRQGGMLSLVNTTPEVARFLQIARLLEVLHVKSAQKTSVPVLSPGAAPLWSKSLSVNEGVENLAYYRRRIAEMTECLPLSKDARFDLALAVSEALGNVYDHTCGTGCVMSVRAYADRVVVEVVDCGEGFELAPDEEPESSEERGRGIRLMRMLVDSVEVRKRSDGQGTFVRLIKLI